MQCQQQKSKPAHSKYTARRHHTAYLVYVDAAAAGTEASCADDIAANDIVSYTDLLLDQVPMIRDVSLDRATHLYQFKQTHDLS